MMAPENLLVSVALPLALEEKLWNHEITRLNQSTKD